MNRWKWFYPGLKVKRWVALIVLGVLIFSLGMVFIIGKNLPREFYLFVTSYVRQGIIGFSLVLLGIICAIKGTKKLNKRIIGLFLPEGDHRLLDMLYEDMLLSKGINIVVIGGGTGLHSLLRGLKEYSSNITAIVTVSDDGGSSGRLRDELNILPPGDIRQCIAALAPLESTMLEVFESRFKGEGPLHGHSVGNLLLAAMTELKDGDFNKAVQELSKVLAVRGRVVPSTVENVTLCAEMSDGMIIRGETNITSCPGSVSRVFLQPSDVRALPEAIQAIRNADLVVIGPGSLYTSIIPNLLVRDILVALRKTAAPKIYVCNIMTQPGETDGYTASDHAARLIKLTGKNSIDYIVLNNKYPSLLLKHYESEDQFPVKVDRENLEKLGIKKLVTSDLVREDELVRHDPKKLAACILEIANEAVPFAGLGTKAYEVDKLRETLMKLRI
ncbi:MAG TPA: YvcK family protein [bacterium]|nr:YvcK family protein [bacterium]